MNYKILKEETSIDFSQETKVYKILSEFNTKGDREDVAESILFNSHHNPNQKIFFWFYDDDKMINIPRYCYLIYHYKTIKEKREHVDNSATLEIKDES